MAVRCLFGSLLAITADWPLLLFLLQVPFLRLCVLPPVAAAAAVGGGRPPHDAEVPRAKT